jgi:hypothetical protein
MRLVVVLAGVCAAVAGCGGGSDGDTPAGGLGRRDTALTVEITGLGGIAFIPQAPPCESVDGKQTFICEKRVWRDTAAVLKAVPPPGWVFGRWYVLGGWNLDRRIEILQPHDPLIYIPRGTEGRVGAFFAPKVAPIRAKLDPATGTTVYTAQIRSPRHSPIDYRWSGPECGTWSPEDGMDARQNFTVTMRWTHPEPCAPTGPVTLTVSGWEEGGTVTCTYTGGFEDGTGFDCIER